MIRKFVETLRHGKCGALVIPSRENGRKRQDTIEPIGNFTFFLYSKHIHTKQCMPIFFILNPFNPYIQNTTIGSNPIISHSLSIGDACLDGSNKRASATTIRRRIFSNSKILYSICAYIIIDRNRYPVKSAERKSQIPCSDGDPCVEAWFHHSTRDDDLIGMDPKRQFLFKTKKFKLEISFYTPKSRCCNNVKLK